MEKRLIRPIKGRVFLGVCAGLGNYFNVDPILIRIIFIILTVWGGIGVLLYLVGIFLIPEEKKAFEDINQASIETKAEEKKQKTANNSGQGEIFFGLFILILGIYFLVQIFIPQFTLSRLWPISLIVIGVLILATAFKKGAS